MSAHLMQSLKALRLARCDYAKTGLAFAADLAPGDLPAAARQMLEAEYHLEDVCGLDLAEGLLAVYHFDHFLRPGRIALRVLVSRENPKIPTISHIYQGADWHEREAHDFYGILFTGHPNMMPLLLPEDADFHPLLKDAGARAKAAAVLAAGEVLDQVPGFTLFDAPAAGDQDA